MTSTALATLQEPNVSLWQQIQAFTKEYRADSILNTSTHSDKDLNEQTNKTSKLTT